MIARTFPLILLTVAVCSGVQQATAADVAAPLQPAYAAALDRLPPSWARWVDHHVDILVEGTPPLGAAGYATVDSAGEGRVILAPGVAARSTPGQLAGLLLHESAHLSMARLDAQNGVLRAGRVAELTADAIAAVGAEQAGLPVQMRRVTDISDDVRALGVRLGAATRRP